MTANGGNALEDIIDSFCSYNLNLNLTETLNREVHVGLVR
jgi:hypothetical protein